MIAARQIFLGTKGGAPTPIPTTLDYVQDGLVSMFDGIENAGRGVHSLGTLYSWADLASGYPAAIANGAIAGDNYLDFSTNAAYATTSNQFDTVERSGSWTLEYILQLPTDIVCVLYASPHLESTSRNVVSISRINTDCQICIPVNNTRVRWVTLDQSLLHSVFRFTAVKDITTTTTYINGVELTGTASTLPSTYRYFGNNKDASVVETVANGVPKYYHARLYNRTLTSAEIAANYAIDKERFNLT